MTYRVQLTAEAEHDLVRLADFLAERRESAARHAGSTIKAALRSLARMPARARRTSDDLHEFAIRFGQSGYVVRFRVDHDTVVIARIYHMREDRRGSDE
ncbi:MAG: type II toxin-antitoxin system RelE/ParE family toxin [Brevundimonas sp.]|uniref:type II toxin-antitoxin system RelE/ParE family toxin n=1 Tax=Brevundimonas sp. TaxID=1871086 RepID=UPI00271BB4F1|nr:type II toxin-antitoxin system RelE/ParE family toxin [Brevundimonas sp.]MDO9587246.1 type II toxin-antitoxin system RelE/ParE family toxin [Brevundimonas sp.]